jgi:hypothetical protein
MLQRNKKTLQPFGGVKKRCIFAPPKKAKHHETDISAIQQKTQEQARFQGENGQRQREKDIVAQTGERP